MIFTTIRDSVTDEEILINLEQLCYIKKDSETGDYELWFSHERGLGLNGMTVNGQYAEKIFTLIKTYAKKLDDERGD